MVSRSLATAAARAGMTVLILDMDTQQNSTNWRRRRPDEEQLPLVQFTTENDLEETLRRARAAKCDLVIIDTPPGRSTEAPAAVEAADLVLIPCTPEVEFLRGVATHGAPGTDHGQDRCRGAEPRSAHQSQRGRGHPRRCPGPRPCNGAGRFPPIQRTPRREPARPHGPGNPARKQGGGRNRRSMGLALCRTAVDHKCNCAQSSVR